MKQKPSSRRRRSSNLLKAKRGSEQYQSTNSSALYAYSPYQHVTDGTAYPAVLFLTGANDPRVNPANSRKMTARLQAATNPKRLVFLRTSSTTGHGIDSSLDEQVEAGADVWAFLFDQLGLRMDAVKTK
jgi:prolyl oligopeptidase